MFTTRPACLSIWLFSDVAAFAPNDFPRPRDELLYSPFEPASRHHSREGDHRLLYYSVVRKFSPFQVYFQGRKHIKITGGGGDQALPIRIPRFASVCIPPSAFSESTWPTPFGTNG